MVRPLTRPVVAGLALVAVTTGGTALAAPVADYQMPFACHQEWTGSTRSSHSPSVSSVDFNRVDDLGQPVLAAAAGVVTGVTDLGNTSYGLYIKVSHGNDEGTLYAHLSAAYVVPGQRVDQGQLLGAVGTSGGSTGPHLHFEERKGSTVVTPYFDGEPYRMPETSRSENCVHVPVSGDWDDDGRDNLGVFQRRWHGWFQQRIGALAESERIGRGLDAPLVGDWDGDGTTDVGVRSTMTGRFVLRTTAGVTDRTVVLGNRYHVGVAGDWDGDGLSEVGLWRPGVGGYRLRMRDGTLQEVAIGSPSTVPVTGDFNGDGRTDLAVFDPVTATWTTRLRTLTGWARATSVRAGLPGELPVAGDWNADGIDDRATWNRETGSWSQTLSNGRTRLRYFGAPE